VLAPRPALRQAEQRIAVYRQLAGITVPQVSVEEPPAADCRGALDDARPGEAPAIGVVARLLGLIRRREEYLERRRPADPEVRPEQRSGDAYADGAVHP